MSLGPKTAEYLLLIVLGTGFEPVIFSVKGRCPKPTRRTERIGKGEDGSVDNSFYDWRYLAISTPKIISHPSPGNKLSSFPNQPKIL